MVNNQQLTYKNSICILTHIHKENLISYSNCEPLAAPVLEPAGRVDKRRLIGSTASGCLGGFSPGDWGDSSSDMNLAPDVQRISRLSFQAIAPVVVPYL